MDFLALLEIAPVSLHSYRLASAPACRYIAVVAFVDEPRLQLVAVGVVVTFVAAEFAAW